MKQIFLLLLLLPLSPLCSAAMNVDILPVDSVWSVHRTASPVLFTGDGYQYVAYYNAGRQLTLAQRKLTEDRWRFRHFPVRTRWATGSHAQIALSLDGQGHLHLVPYRRDLSEEPSAPPNMIYYRTRRPHDLDSMEQIPMVTPDEPNPGYPLFITAPDGLLYFEYRIGGSGSGSQRWNVYDEQSRTWENLPVFLDGQNQMSAYGGPRMGPDGYWHCLWMWRNSPDAETNHSLSYMRSPDLRHWQTAAGQSVDLPVTGANRDVLVDPTRPGEGLINMVHHLGWDSQQRPVVTYHKYDANGFSQIFNARFEDGAWNIVAATDWDFRWDFSGRGALPAEVRAGGVSVHAPGQLRQRIWAEKRVHLVAILDEQTLQPLEVGPAGNYADEQAPDWRREHRRPESSFTHRPMSVVWINDRGNSGEAGVHYQLRWEVGPPNRDRAVAEPWPDPTVLRLFRISP